MKSNRKAFLDTIAYAEGTSTHPLTVNDGYDVIVTGLAGREVFTDYSAHPFAPEHPSNNGIRRKSRLINSRGLTSNAAGRYQHMLVHWHHYRDLLKLPDFGPESQDKWALQLIRERHALDDIDSGHFIKAVGKVSNLWASLPGANYPGQRMRSMADLENAYECAGGTFA